MNVYYMFSAARKLVDKSMALAPWGSQGLPSQCICATSQPLSVPKVWVFLSRHTHGLPRWQETTHHSLILNKRTLQSPSSLFGDNRCAQNTLHRQILSQSHSRMCPVHIFFCSPQRALDRVLWEGRGCSGWLVVSNQQLYFDSHQEGTERNPCWICPAGDLRTIWVRFSG